MGSLNVSMKSQKVKVAVHKNQLLVMKPILNKDTHYNYKLMSIVHFLRTNFHFQVINNVSNLCIFSSPCQRQCELLP